MLFALHGDLKRHFRAILIGQYYFCGVLHKFYMGGVPRPPGSKFNFLCLLFQVGDRTTGEFEMARLNFLGYCI